MKKNHLPRMPTPGIALPSDSSYLDLRRVFWASGVCPKDNNDAIGLAVVRTTVNVTFVQFVVNVYQQTINQIKLSMGITQITQYDIHPPENPDIEIKNPRLIGGSSQIPNVFQSGLPSTFYPTFYDINLHISENPLSHSDIPQYFVNGTVVITLKDVENDTDTITFNALRLQNLTATMSNDGINITKGPYAIDANEGIYAVKLDSKLVAGVEYKLHLSYTTVTNNGFRGFYTSHYKTAKRHLDAYTISTQFEPRYARTLFPCFDEPRFRAQFMFTVTHPKNMKAVSNMPALPSSVEGNEGEMTVTEFEPTPPIPSYTVALAIGDFESSEARFTEKGTLIQIHGRREYMRDTEMALNYAEGCLDLLQNLFHVEYPLSKLDLTGITKFTGAMENIGNVFVSEKLIFLNNRYADKSAYDNALVTIAHEFSHQWFGNIVTPIDWSQAFMSEGFATFMSYYIMNELKNDTNDLNLKFAMNPQRQGMEVDSFPTHPVEVVEKNLFEHHAIFDPIIYGKACSIFNMVRGVVGDRIFFNALQKYLEDNKNGHAHWKKLTAAIQNGVINSDLEKINFTELLEGWITTPGYPVIKVSRNGTHYTLKAEPFRLIKDGVVDSRWPLGKSWPVPIWFRRSSNLSKVEFLIMPPNAEITFNVKNETDLIFVNTENYGFYRVHYETPSLAQTTTQAIRNDTTGHLAGARLRTCLDLFPLFYAGHIDSAQFFNTLELFRKDSVTTYHAILSVEIQKMLQRIGDTPGYGDLKKYLKGFLSDLVHNGIPNSATTKFSQKILNDIECAEGKLLCKGTALQMFVEGVYKVCKGVQELVDCVIVPIADRERVYCEAAKSGKKYYDYITRHYVASQNPFEKVRLLQGIACTKDSETVETLFNTITTPNDDIHDTNRAAVFNVLFANNPSTVKKMFIAKASEIADAFPDLFGEFATTALTARDDVDEVPEFLKNNADLATKYEYIFRKLQNTNKFELRFKKDLLPTLKPTNVTVARHKKDFKSVSCGPFHVC
uniref:Aminopeptidase n=1 Tax=Panagrellus redivivus TaxID=6233 RepID=A0A7E4UXT3_PANRE